MSRNSGPYARTSSFLALGCVGFIASASAPAMAQDQPEPTRLEGVTVTDTGISDGYRVETVSSPKATAALVDTPRTVNVITEDLLKDSGSFSLQDALRTVPGITLGAGEGGTASADIPLIRGVEATADTYVDGARDVGSQTRETFAVEQIEVYKGPNSAFGGRGSAGGSINIVSKLAKEGNFIAGQGTVGTDDFYRASVDINQMVGEHAAVRVAGLYHNADVPGRDAVFDKRWGIAPSVTVGLGSPIKGTLSYYHYETDAMPDYGIPLTSRPPASQQQIRVPANVDYDNFYGLVVRDFQKTRADSLTGIFSAELGGGWTISNTARYSNTRNNYIVTNPDDSAGNVANGLVWRNIKSRNSQQDGFVNNLNLGGVFETGSIGHSVSVGAEYSRADSVNTPYVVATGDRTCPAAEIAAYNCTDLANPNPADPWTGSITESTTPSPATTEDFSLYAFDTVTIVPQLLLNGGIRWTTFKATGEGVSRGTPFTASNSADFFTWQAALLYKPTESSTLYVSFADSANPPGNSVGEGAENISTSNGNYEPQRTKNFEVGAKAELFDGGLLLTAAAFQADRENIIDNDPMAGPITIASKARLRGFEVGASGRVGPVSLSAGYTLVDSAIRDGSTLDGNDLPNTPKHNVAVTANVQVTPQLTLGGGVYGASARFADTANLISAPGYIRVDANASYQVTQAVRLRLNVQNVGDRRYIVKLRNPHFAVPSAGRQALLSADIRF